MKIAEKLSIGRVGINSEQKDPISFFRDGRAPIPKNKIISRVMSAIRAKNTKPEKVLRKALRLAKLNKYMLHLKNIPGRPDISYPKKKLAIFVNGCFWHRCPKCNPGLPKSHKKFWGDKFKKNMERDKRKSAELRKLGWKVITVWECDIQKQLISVVKRITQYCSGAKK